MTDPQQRRGRGRPPLPGGAVQVRVWLPEPMVAELDRIVGGTYRRGPWIREQIEAALHRLRQGELP